MFLACLQTTQVFRYGERFFAIFAMSQYTYTLLTHTAGIGSLAFLVKLATEVTKLSTYTGWSIKVSHYPVSSLSRIKNRR